MKVIRKKVLENIGRECVRELTKSREGGTVTTMCTMPRDGFPRGKRLVMHNQFPIRMYKADDLLSAIQRWMKRNAEQLAAAQTQKGSGK